MLQSHQSIVNDGADGSPNQRESTPRRWTAQLTNPPPVSCICLTYGRAALLEEAIYSFLRQDYPGPKEMIILNDYDQQTLAFDHPEVQVINVSRRFRTVGEKMNAAVALASHNLLFVWDDDDIYLPHRLSFSVAKFERKKGFFKPNQAWFWNNGQLSGPIRSLFHAGSCWSRSVFDAVRGYPAEGTGYDLIFELKLAYSIPDFTLAYDAVQRIPVLRPEMSKLLSDRTMEVAPEEIYYIYRWGGIDSYHLSGFGDLEPGENRGHNEVTSFVQQQANRGEIPQGYIRLQPHWNTDYRQLVSSSIAMLAEQQADLRAREELSPAIE